MEFTFGENNNYHQIGKGYLEFDITVRKSDSTNFHYDNPVLLVKIGFAFCFKEARLSNSLGSDIGTNKFCGQVSTFMEVISNEDGELLYQIDKYNENDVLICERVADSPPQIRSTPHRKMFSNNHTDPNKGKKKGYLCSEDIFGFCKNSKR